MPSINFCGADNQAQSPNVDAQMSMNIYPEAVESGTGKARLVMYRRPGLSEFSTLAGETQVLGAFEFNDRGYAAAKNLWEIPVAGGAGIDRGALAAPLTGPATFAANQANQILICSGGKLFVFATDTNILTPVNMSQFAAPVTQVDFSDGYFFALLQGNTFQLSALEDGLTWSGLDVNKPSVFAENIVSIKAAFRELWVQGNKYSAGYQNTGDLNTPFSPAPGAYMEQGNGAQYATVGMDNSYFWIGANSGGQAMAWRANGYTPMRVSTHNVEFAWQSYSRVDDAVGFTYQDQGHTFWEIFFPTAGKSWVYDAAVSAWHQRSFLETSSGNVLANRARCHMKLGGKHLFGDWKTGTIYQSSHTQHTDFGNPLKWTRRSPYITKDSEWMQMAKLEFEMGMGVGPMPPLLDGNGNPRSPQVQLRWSDDGARTWSDERTIDIGQAGAYGTRAIERRLGRFWGTRGRVIELSGSDPIPTCIVDAYA